MLEDIEDIGKRAKISAITCIGCGICTKKCPFGAISIVNLPKQLDYAYTLYSYGENSFRVYARPSIKRGSCIGLLGSNGLGKSTILKVLSGDIKLDLTNKTLKKLISGNEVFKYLTALNENKLKVSYKSQDVMAVSKSRTPVKKILKRLDETLIKRFQLQKLENRRLKDLSGGEVQRLMIAKVCSTKADSYLFDEPAAFLDIKQRIRASYSIMNMTEDSKYVMCIEHDLCVLDYICDHITCLYGETSCYGVITSLYGTFHGINNYLDGRFKKENIKFRDQPIKFNLSKVDDDFVEGYAVYNYDKSSIAYGSEFKLDIEPGTFSENQVVLLIGENGTGKSSFINMIAGNTKKEFNGKFPELVVSHKQQNPYISDFDGTVKQLLNYKIPKNANDTTFINMILKPLKIPILYDVNISSLSGGQVQKLSIALCLGTSANAYLLDEPSAYIDVDDRLYVAKIIKHYATFYHKTVFLVEHDIIMATSISDKVIVFEGEPGVSCVAKSPQPLASGINEFLKSINITMRRDKHSNRPRINKMNGAKDTEQKSSGTYYLIE